ncbi:MAG TPA: FkbM family methyltransferase [Rhizomicrobium sp.]
MSLSPLHCFIGSNSHGSYCVPASSRHRPAAAAILKGKVWEADTLALLGSHAATGDIVHAGTYFGDFLPALSRAVAADACVWAFEPSQENFRCAEITLKLNAIANVVLTHAALGAAPGEALLCIGEQERRAAGGSSTIVSEKKDGLAHEIARVVRLDDVVPAHRHVAILQLDVEHYEQQALDGALGTIRRCQPLLVLESLPADQSWFAANILSLGYDAAGKVDANRIFRPAPGR